MSNLIRRTTEEKPATIATPAYDPMRIMREMMSWDPFREMSPSWFPMIRETAFSPAFEVKENGDTYSFKADLPGIAEKDLEVKLAGNRMTISGKREEEKQDKNDTYYTYERSFGSFARTFTLPDAADLGHIAADLKDGVLTIIVSKKKAEPAKTVAIKTGETKKS